MSTRTASQHDSDPAAVLGRAYPTRGAVDVLTQRVCAMLQDGGFAPGDRFLTDDEIIQHSGLSRSTVRRALQQVKEQGWLHRKAGMGTYVGQVTRGEDGLAQMKSAAMPQLRELRLGLLAFSRKNSQYDWLTPQVVQGINDVSEEHGVNLQLLTGLNGKLSESLDRLTAVRPDVIISLSDDPSDAMLLRAASENDFKCIIGGTLYPELDIPRVCEDNRGGMDMVVRQLAEQGHRRIGLAMRRWVGSWLFKRHEQWKDTLLDLGLEYDEQLMHWFSMSDQKVTSPESIDEFEQWIKRAKPSAIIGGHYLPAIHMGHLMREGRVSVPEDVSLAVIDMHPDMETMLGVEPAAAVLPLREIGRKAVELAAAWRDGTPPPAITKIPMSWQTGPTLAPYSG
ncbi:MAG: LacI family DNA-binding transcriptional regulator [Planctomycetota bacterium]